MDLMLSGVDTRPRTRVFDCFSGPMLSRRSPKFLVAPSFPRTQPLQLLSEDQSASEHGETVSREALPPSGKPGQACNEPQVC